MANRFDITILGDKVLAKRLRTLTADLERVALDKALEAGARLVLAAAQNSPLIRRRSGRLASHMLMKPLQKKINRVGWGVWTGRAADMGIVPSRSGKQWYYPAHVHLGHKLPLKQQTRLHRTLKRLSTIEFGTRRVAPRPFLRRALLDNRNAVISAISNELSRQITFLGP